MVRSRNLPLDWVESATVLERDEGALALADHWFISVDRGWCAHARRRYKMIVPHVIPTLVTLERMREESQKIFSREGLCVPF